MSKKNKMFIIAFLAINVIYVAFVLGSKLFDCSKGESPTITFNSNEITVSVKAGEKELLAGVTASDKEDGNISKDVFIYGISTFDQNKSRTVTYAVFDSDSNLVKSSRKIKYSDYTAPKFTALSSLMNMSLNNSDNSYVGAISSVDGNIGNKVSITKFDNEFLTTYKYNVTDSTGTTSSLEVDDEITLNSILSNIKINLKKYIVYVKKGTVLNPVSYIASVETSLGKQNELKSLVVSETNYDMTKEGVYEVKYTLNRSNGDYGITKLIVIVE